MPETKIKYILLDVEGTTTSIHFVHDILFPYAEKNLEGYLKEFAARPEIKAIVDGLQTRLRSLGRETSGFEVVALLKSWIREDKKEPLLKELQGHIWQQGYASGDIKGHIYEDVPGALQKWSEQGIGLGIYSSGSVLAQRMIFGYSIYGDLNHFLQNNFDTAVGGKREVGSYIEIARQLELAPKDILFLSDIPEELQAAQTAGLRVKQAVRAGSQGDARFSQVSHFAGVLC